MTQPKHDTLRALLSHPETLSEADIKQLKQAYPFFQLPQAMLTAEQLADMTPQQRADAVASLVVAMADNSLTEQMIDPDTAQFADFYPAEPSAPAPSTNQTIDKFLATYGGDDPNETETLEKLIFNPVADYSQQLAQQEETDIPSPSPTGNSQDDLINRFILSSRSAEQPSPAPEPEIKAPAPAPSDGLLSESLAKIYIKTHRYERAYEILTRLSLDFPEKNAYFADQLRFLRKLMLAESYRQKRNTKDNQTE
jgi:hypothetical protein